MLPIHQYLVQQPNYSSTRPNTVRFLENSLSNGILFCRGKKCALELAAQKPTCHAEITRKRGHYARLVRGYVLNEEERAGLAEVELAFRREDKDTAGYRQAKHVRQSTGTSLISDKNERKKSKHRKHSSSIEIVWYDTERTLRLSVHIV